MKFKKYLWLIPSSFFFFLIVPSFTIVNARNLEKLLGIAQLSQLTFFFFGFPLLVYGGYYVFESIRILFFEGEGIPLGDIVHEEESSILIQSGIYSRTRNPMLFGYILVLMGLGAAVKSLIAFLMFPLIYLGIWTLWIKKVEEPGLEKRFGKDYKNYKTTTPFLIPRFSRH
jgi:protein-S-isoprenylcysteine O-methyltransferase Ste14